MPEQWIGRVTGEEREGEREGKTHSSALGRSNQPRGDSIDVKRELFLFVLGIITISKRGPFQSSENYQRT